MAANNNNNTQDGKVAAELQIGDSCLAKYQEGDSKAMYKAHIVAISEESYEVKWIGFDETSQVPKDDVFPSREFAVPEDCMRMFRFRCLLDHAAESTNTMMKLSLRDKLVEIAGPHENLNKAEEFLETVVDSYIVEPYPIPSAKVGRLMGQKGSTRESLQQKSGALIDIPPKKAEQDEEDVEISLIGTAETVENAKEAIKSLLEGGSRPPRVQQESQSRSIVVAPRHIPYVIGTGGAIIKRLQADSGARLEVSRDGSGEIRISGTEEQMAMAIDLIHEVVEQRTTAEEEEEEDEGGRYGGKGKGKGKGKGEGKGRDEGPGKGEGKGKGKGKGKGRGDDWDSNEQRGRGRDAYDAGGKAGGYEEAAPPQAPPPAKSETPSHQAEEVRASETDEFWSIQGTEEPVEKTPAVPVPAVKQVVAAPLQAAPAPSASQAAWPSLNASTGPAPKRFVSGPVTSYASALSSAQRMPASGTRVVGRREEVVNFAPSAVASAWAPMQQPMSAFPALPTTEKPAKKEAAKKGPADPKPNEKVSNQQGPANLAKPAAKGAAKPAAKGSAKPAANTAANTAAKSGKKGKANLANDLLGFKVSAPSSRRNVGPIEDY